MANERRQSPARGRAMWWWLLATAVALVVGFVCGRWAFAPPAATVEAAVPATVAVSEMTVGTSVPVAVSAAWSAEPFGVGAAGGTLTSVEVADGDTVQAGQRLYTVDLRPVVAGVGTVPAFRDLAKGDSGADVAQLQLLLAAAGHYKGEITGKFASSTRDAVKAWQKDLGVTADGVVRAGDVVYAERLPARVRIATDMAVGRRLAPGDVVLSVLSGAPEFVATVQPERKVDATLPIEVTFDSASVQAVVKGTRQDKAGNTLLILAQADGAPVCGAGCDLVPLDERQAIFPARQVVIPEVTGPGVPAAAVWFNAAGEPYLVAPDGGELPVTIVGQGQGRVVLDGVDVGTVVVLAGTKESS